MNCLVIISTPAGGKGTISDYIKENYNYEHISVGDLLRDEIENNSDIGKKIKKQLDIGSLVNNEILFSILKERLAKQKKDFIIDGTPRILEQAKIFDLLLDKLHISIKAVIFIKTEKDLAEKRMLDRVVCEDCNESYSLKYTKNCPICYKKLTKRSDDNIEIFEKRYKTFIEKTMPVVEYYKEKELLVEISNNKTLEDVYKQVDDIMKGI